LSGWFALERDMGEPRGRNKPLPRFTYFAAQSIKKPQRRMSVLKAISKWVSMCRDCFVPCNDAMHVNCPQPIKKAMHL